MIKFETETEQWLYEERNEMMEERDQALEALRLEKEKQKELANFSVYMYQVVDNAQSCFSHPADGATMVISKNGMVTKLESDEIKDVVRAAGGNFKR